MLHLVNLTPECGRNTPLPECPSRNAPISKSQCPNREAAMPHFWTECPTFLVVVYIYIYYIILKIIVRLLNAFHLHLFLAAIYIYVYIYVYIYNIFYIILTSFFITLLNLPAIYIYNIFYIILTSFCYIIECAPVVLVSSGNIYIFIYVCIYKTYFI